MRGLLRDTLARAKDEFDAAVDPGTDAWSRAKKGGQEFTEKGEESSREAGRQATGFAESARATVNDIKDDLTSQRR